MCFLGQNAGLNGYICRQRQTISVSNPSKPEALKPIPYARQEVTESDVAAVTEALQSDFLTGGPRVAAFEAAFADHVQAPYAVAVSSGTAALHLCALALDVGPGQRWLTAPLTFVASANCIRYAGGEVDLIDIDPATYLMDLDQLEARLQAAPAGTYHGVVAVDFAGCPIDMQRLRQLADRYQLRLIEDGCHAPGGWFETSQGTRHHCGDGSLADLCIFSFHPTKHITAGEGGMITTADEGLCRRLLHLRNHGITRDRDLMQADHGGWYYEMLELGYNYRLSDLHAALGTAQLQRAEANLARRRAIARRYDAAFAGTAVCPAPAHPGHAYHLYPVQVPHRQAVFDALRQAQIFIQVHYIPVHYHPAYQALGWKVGQFPHVEAYYDRCLSLPMFPALTEAEQDYVIEALLGIVEGLSKDG